LSDANTDNNQQHATEQPSDRTTYHISLANERMKDAGEREDEHGTHRLSSVQWIPFRSLCFY